MPLGNYPHISQSFVPASEQTHAVSVAPQAPIVASTSSKPQNIEDVFRKTIEYESLKELQELVLNRRLLREEMARPETGSASLLVTTKLAVVEVFLHYAIHCLALKERSHLQAQMLEYHTAEISQILEKHFSDVTPKLRTKLGTGIWERKFPAGCLQGVK
jgi:hypothetical protein